ncbi:MAG: ribosome maturation factor RimM [Acutalibacteraceae bacterium]
MLKKYLEIGKIVGTHGIKGEMRVTPWCDSLQFFCQFDTLYLKNGEQKLNVKSRPHKNVALVKAEGIDDPQQADLYRGKILYMNRDDITLDKDVFFVQDIIGLEVLDADTKKSYGTVTDVLKTGANDVYEVKGKDGKSYYIPVIDDVVKQTDPENGCVLIKPMKGIFDDED